MKRLALAALLAACGGPDAPRSRDVHEEPDLARDARVAGSSRPSRLRGPSEPEPEPEPEPVHAHAYRGKTIDLDLKEADLHNVFRLLADVGGISIVVADDVRGTVTLRLRSVPWDQALDTIIQLEHLALHRDGTFYLISRASSASSSASAPP